MLRLAAIGLVAAVIALLALRVLVLATVGAVAPKPPPRAQEAPAATATPTAEAPAPAAPELDPATAAAGNACPEGVTPPDGVPVGWLARVAGCSDIALATLDGVRQWVRRDRLDDDIYYQLPEVTP
jgi:predicted lipid-binding transport protein (Tim44 family)